jgi:small-conductance mechanosensitive channel
MMPWDQEFWTSTFDQLGESLSSWLPAIAGALLLLIVGWLVARLTQAILVRLLRRVGLDKLAERTGIARGLTTIGWQRTLSYLLARTTYWLILVFFVLLALGALGLTDVVTSALDSFMAFLPRLVAAMVIFLAGAFIARIAGDAVTAVTLQSNVATGRVLGQAIRYSILLVVIILALDELGVQTTILTTLIIITIGAIGLGLALAFGLGNRQLAHGIMAGFHAREEFKPGQQITVGQNSGRLVRIGATKALLDTDDGQVSVPNIVLLNEVVQLHAVSEVPPANAEQPPGQAADEEHE